MKFLTRVVRDGLLVMLALVSGCFVLSIQHSEVAQAAGTVTDCSSDSQLRTALASGGLVSFSCGSAPVTITLQSGQLLITNTATIDGGSNVTISGGNATRVFSVTNDVSFTIKNLTVANGNVNGNGTTNAYGAGLYNNGTVTIDNVTFTNNSVINGPPDYTFVNPYDGNDGGAIFNAGTITVTSSNFISNSAISSSALNNNSYNNIAILSNGGAIVNIGTGLINNSTFISNTAVGGATYGAGHFGNGGAIANYSVLNISNSTFSGNSAKGGNSDANDFAGGATGGALYNSKYLTLTDSTIVSNTAIGGSNLNNAGAVSTNGGGLYNENYDDNDYHGYAIIANSTFAFNQALGSLLSDNSRTESYGGGIANNANGITLTNVTLYNNNATNGTNLSTESGTVVQNTIIAQDSFSGNVATRNCYESNYNLIDGGNNLEYSSSGQIDCYFYKNAQSGNPNFGPLANNGGPTLTLALQSGSAAIDNGNDAVCAASTINNLDQRGVSRSYGAHCDIGAYEYNPTAPTTISIVYGNNQTASISTTFTNPLVVKVTDANNQPVSGTVVTFYAPTSGAGGTFAINQNVFAAVADASGIATATTFTANNVPGSYNITASASGIITPATFTLTNTNLYTYYLPFVANNANNFTTYLAFQNIGSATANANITYFDSNGNALSAATIVTTVAQYAEVIPNNPFAAGTSGAGIITSTQPLNVIVPEATPYGGSAYAVSSRSSNSLIAPFALNNAFGDFTTQLNIFNGGSTPVTATVTFYGTIGGSNSTTITSSTSSVKVGAHQAASLNQNTLPSGFSGWAQITGSANALVAQVLEQSPSTKFVAIANAIANPSTTEYAPAIFNGGYGSFYTGANIVNPNSNSVTVTVTYYDLSAGMTTTTPFAIPAYGVVSIFDGATSGSGIPSGGLPSGFTGAVAVSSVGGPIAMSVNENGGVTSAGNSRSGTYAAISNGSSTVGLPVMSDGGYTYTTGDTILNTSSQPVTGTISYYNPDGTATGVSKSFTIAGHGSEAYYQGDGNLASGFYGTAVITETSGPANSLVVTTNAQNIALFYTYSEPNS